MRKCFRAFFACEMNLKHQISDIIKLPLSPEPG
jgi:hypothetical protein